MPEGSGTVGVSTPVTGRGWKLQGIVHSRVTLDTLFLHFGEAAVHGRPPVTRKVVATTHVPAQGIEARANPDTVSVQVERRGDIPTRFELAVTPRSDLPPGPFKAWVTIDLVLPTGDRRSGEVILLVAGTVLPEVWLLPARLLFGSLQVGMTAESFVVLQAPPGVEVAVERIESDSPDVRVEPAAIEGFPAGRTFRVTLEATELGDQTQVVRFFHRKAGQPLVPLSPEVSYRGEARGLLPESRTEGQQP